MATAAQVQRLEDAMWQLLDDMGKDGKSVCLAAKAEARLAYEPFREEAEGVYDDWMSIDDARKVMDSLS